MAIQKKKKILSKNTSPKKTSIANIELRDLLIAGAIVVVIVLLGIFKNQFVAATVNGQQISRLELIKELEKRDGKRVLSSIVTEKLILQEANKKGIKVSPKDLDEEIKKVEKSFSSQGQNLDLFLSQRNMTRETLKEQIKLEIMVKKILGDKTKVTDKEVDDYIEKNKESIPEGSNPNEIKNQVRQELEQQKLNEKIQELISSLQQKSKIEYLLKF